jgi:RimJ/RimL family protein N-acetyltransferase
MVSFATERLLLRPRTLADTEACLAMDRDPEVVRFVGGPWSEPAAHRAFVEARTRGPYPAGMGYWTISWRHEPASFLGWALLIPIGAVGPEIEIGWRLRRVFWGQGIATEAAVRVLRHALGALALPEVVADIHPHNVASMRVALKIGMRRRGEVLYQGQPAVRYSARLGEAGPAP